MITIYSAQDVKLLESSNIGTGSKGYYSLMQHDYIVLDFSLETPIDFGIGSYVDLTGQFDDALGGKLSKKYYVTEKQSPTYNTATGGYDYELRLNAYYWLWNNYIFKYTPESAGSEASWSLTAALDVHLGVFLRNLASLGFTFNGQAYTYSIDSTVQNKAVAMTYDNVHLLDALFSLGGKDYYDCDVWITENVIHFGRCELGTSVKIERGVEAQDITRSDSKGTFATRIYAFGSTRNIPTNYRPIDEQLVVNGVVQKRLMLPKGTPYIDAYPNMSQNEVVEDVVVFDNIYPRRVGTLQNVTSRKETVDNEDGTQSTYTYYRYKDSGLAFNEEYILEGQELQITFQSGKLNGMTFGVTFNPDEKNPAEQLWEIVGNEDYGRLLPDDTIKPEDGDEYILFGFDIQLVSDQYIPAAEQELLQKAQEYVNKTKVDDGTYTATLRSDWVFADQIHRTFDVGQKITLVAPDFFTDNRVSRVIGWEVNLDIPYDSPIYTIGESAQYSRLTDIEDKVDTLTFKGNTYTGVGGSGVYVIRTNDSTPASDSNVFSALRSLAQFLRKDKDDLTPYMLTVLGLSTFKSGAQFGEFVKSLYAGKGAGIDELGNAEFESVRVRSYFECMELIINRLSAIEGDQLLTEADTIESVDDLGDNCYGLHLRSKWEGYFTAQYPNNVLKGIINTLATGSGVYYTSWMRVNSVNTANNYIEVTLYPGEEVPAGTNYPPCEMMKIARWGNQTDTKRQSCIYLSSTEGRIVRLTGVTRPIIDRTNYGATFGELPEFLRELDLPIAEGQDYLYARGIVVQDIIRIDYQGKPVSEIVDRGPWSATGDYYCEALNPNTGRYEISDVWYNGCKYRCAKTGTTTAPAWNNTDWAMVEGNPDFTVDFAETDYLFDPDKFNLTLTIIARLYNTDITADILDADVQWTRYSEDANGVERVASDNAWALKHAGAGKSIDLTVEDCDFNGYVPKVLKFIATVTLRDGMGNEAGTANAVFQY